MNRKLVTLVVFALSVPTLQAGPTVSEKAVATAPPETPWGGPVLGGGMKSSGEFTEGSLFMVYPLLDSIGEKGSMEGTLLYFEPYVSWGEGGDLGASLGFGFRHLFSDQTVDEALTVTNPGLFGEGIFVGANVFSDYGRTAYESDFWQGGLGVEAGTRYLELRGNYYVPFSDDRTIDRFSSSEVSRHTTSTTRTSYDAPTVSGGQIVQNGTRRTTNTTRTTTTRTDYEVFEEGLEGWDLELALLVPGLDEYCDLRLVGGYYSFTGDRSQIDIEGWRTGVELRPIPALVLHATWFESDHLYQDNWLAGFRVELPLEGMRESFKSRRRHLAERLFEPVRRKNSAITTSGVESEEVSVSTSTTTSQTSSLSGVTQVIGNLPPEMKPPMDNLPPLDNRN